LKKIALLVPVFIATFVLFSSFHYYWFVPKITTVSYTIESDVVDTVEVFYNLGKGWSKEWKEKAFNQVGQSNFHEFEFNLNKFPDQIRLDFWTEKDTVLLSNVNISNNAKNEFDLKKSYSRSIDMESIQFLPDNGMRLITKNGDPFIEFNTHATNRFSQRFENLSAINLIVISSLSLLICFILFRLNFTHFMKHHFFLLSFILIISLAPLNQISRFIPKVESLENRKLASLPNSDEIDVYITQLEAYLKDQFALKPVLTFFDSWLKIKLFETSSQPNITLVGEDGYMFPVVLEILKDYKHQVQFIPEGLASVKNNLEERRDWLKKRGIPFIVVIPPNKQTIYPEKMPKEYIRGQHQGRLDQLLNYLVKNAEIDIIDLRPVLKAKKEIKESPIFYRYDMHWNNLGGFYGYRSLMNKAAEYYPELKPYNFADFDTSTSYYPDGDLASSLLLQDIYKKREIEFEPLFPLKKEEATYYRGLINGTQFAVEGKKLKLVMFHDSYGVNINPFISNHFAKSVFIWDHNFDSELIEIEKPDLVIHEISELFILHLLNVNALEVSQEVKSYKP